MLALRAHDNSHLDSRAGEENLEALAAVVIAYLLGSIDFAVIVARRMGIDIYEHGSGNPGTSNVFRTLGKRAAGMVLLGDALKGIVATAIGASIGGEVVGFAAALARVRARSPGSSG